MGSNGHAVKRFGTRLKQRLAQPLATDKATA